jgi:hypothetical protein
MRTIETSEKMNLHRRRLFGAAALTVAAARLGMIGSAGAQTKPAPFRPIRPGTNTSFGPL